MHTKFIISALALAISTATHAQQQSEEQSIERVEVFGQYKDDASSILRNGLELKEIARSVQIIPEELIRELNPEAIENVLTLTSNAAFLGDNDGRENTFVLRGFQSAPVLRDGFRVETFGGIADPEIYNLDRVEVLKGPDSILFGEADPGGIINMRSKRPLNKEHGEIAVDLGIDGMLLPRFDIGGALSDEHDVNYRLVGLYRYDESWRDFDDANERVFIAPTLSWQINEKTAVTLLAEFTKDDYQADFGTAINTDGQFLAPIEQVNNHPQDRIERHQYTVGADLVHEVSEQWHLSARARYFDAGYDYSALWLPFGIDQETLQYFRVAAQQQQDNTEEALQATLNGDIVLGGKRHRITFGWDYRYSTTEGQTRFNPGVASFLDWTQPDYSELPLDEQDIPIATGFYSSDDIQRIGLFVQDHINLTDALILTLGVRHDSVDRTPNAGSSSTAQDLSNTSGQIGVVYEMSDDWSLFSSYSESFSPNFELDKNNEVIDPQESEGWEIGVKGFDIGDQLSLTFAYFDITKNNVATTDVTALPTDLNPFGSIAAARQDSKGFEFDMAFRFTDSWSMLAAVGHTDTDDNGVPIVGAPDFTGSLWTSYEFDNGMRVGGGAQYVGERFVLEQQELTSVTTVNLDSYTVLNAFIGYSFDDWDVQVNLQNLGNKEYVQAAWGGLSRSVHAGHPFEATVSVRYNF